MSFQVGVDPNLGPANTAFFEYTFAEKMAAGGGDIVLPPGTIVLTRTILDYTVMSRTAPINFIGTNGATFLLFYGEQGPYLQVCPSGISRIQGGGMIGFQYGHMTPPISGPTVILANVNLFTIDRVYAMPRSSSLAPLIAMQWGNNNPLVNTGGITVNNCRFATRTDSQNFGTTLRPITLLIANATKGGGNVIKDTSLEGCMHYSRGVVFRNPGEIDTIWFEGATLVKDHAIGVDVSENLGIITNLNFSSGVKVDGCTDTAIRIVPQNHIGAFQWDGGWLAADRCNLYVEQRPGVIIDGLFFSNMYMTNAQLEAVAINGDVRNFRLRNSDINSSVNDGGHFGVNLGNWADPIRGASIIGNTIKTGPGAAGALLVSQNANPVSVKANDFIGSGVTFLGQRNQARVCELNTFG